MSFLDLITNYLGATTILLLVAMKYYQETPCPAIAHSVEGGYDPLHQEVRANVNTAVAGVKIGDTLLFIVREMSDYRPAPGGGEQTNIPRDPSVCGIYPKIQNMRCDDSGTPDNPNDDRFWFELMVEKNGPCRGERWQSGDGASGRYGAPVSFGPFNIRDGNRELRLSDSRDASVKASITAFAPPPCSGNEAGQCSLFAVAQNIQCNGNGTSGTTDDTYTFDLMVTKNGPCGSNWQTADGKNGRYGTPAPMGPFKISQGIKYIIVSDAQNPGVSVKVTITPPQPCSKQDGVVWPQLPGSINLYLKWGDRDQKVDLYVKREGQWLYHERPRDPKMGRWDNFKASPFDRTDCETLRQNKPIPGKYSVYAYYKGSRSGPDKPSVDVNFYALSNDKPEGNRKITASLPLSNNSPKHGGGKLLATIEVLADGKIIVTQ